MSEILNSHFNYGQTMITILKFYIFCSALFFGTSFAKNVNSGQRIIGGENANAGQFPFVAGINVTTTNGRYFCGGTLYNNQWIITAGQCVYEATLFNIYLGSYFLIGDDPNRLDLATSEYVIHPDFDPMTLENDIGLIRFRMPIEFTDYIKPIYTLPGNNLPAGYTVLATGWGQTSDGDAGLADHLNWARVVSVSNDECKITYGNQIKDTMICAVGEYNEGICNGDTGSPLVELIKMGNGCLTGIASFISGNGCESTDPSGYTRVYWYRDWIRNITGS